MFFATALGIFALAIPAFGAPTRVPMTKRAGPVKPNSFIVTFKDTASKDAFMEAGPGFTESGSAISYNYDIVPASAMTLVGNDISLVQGVAGIKSIEPDMIVSLDYDIGLDGLDHNGYKHISKVSNTPRAEHAGTQGQGVTIYGLDTGIYTSHHCFEGRASWGKTFGDGYQDQDGHGHGTHTAGTAVGNGFGLAVKASMIAVKVLSDMGSGSTSDIIAGINWVVEDSRRKTEPVIATMSLGGAINPSLDDAVASAIGKDIHFTIAAGNSNVDAEGSSPARVPAANTVGAVDSNKQKASFSNYGPILDIWAPGVSITSAWITGPDSTMVLSGTSMATPYVAGTLANVLAKYGRMTPAMLSKALVEHGEPSVTFAPIDVTAKLTSTNKFAVAW